MTIIFFGHLVLCLFVVAVHALEVVPPKDPDTNFAYKFSHAIPMLYVGHIVASIPLRLATWLLQIPLATFPDAMWSHKQPIALVLGTTLLGVMISLREKRTMDPYVWRTLLMERQRGFRSDPECYKLLPFRIMHIMSASTVVTFLFAIGFRLPLCWLLLYLQGCLLGLMFLVSFVNMFFHIHLIEIEEASPRGPFELVS